ncbi:hypothetical protein PN836_008115 [Ningiella sp. W23]|uniref:hypothetical protein n=1 Tax=Ningiella sp. W23 TaxID=3023715 RepID=UPI00375720FC
MRFRFFKLCLTITFTLFFALFIRISAASADDALFDSGDVYRDYVWTVESTEDDGFLRVGGNYGYLTDKKLEDIGFHQNGFIPFGHSLDLDKAVSAKLIVEKLLSHEGTTGFAVQINQSDVLAFPESPHIPEPQTEFPHLFLPYVDVPISALNEGENNAFKFTVNEAHPWDWPQHLVYGITLRVYYNSAKAHSRATVNRPPNNEIQLSTTLSVSSQGPVHKVDYIGRFEDVDFNGNGQRYKWQYAIHKGKLGNHIGTSQKAPHSFQWDSTWLPEQSRAIEILAIVTAPDGIAYVTPVVDDLSLSRSHSIEMAWLNDVEDHWTTRSKAVDAEFTLTGDVEKASAAKMYWASWSSCYSHGVVINGYLTYTGMDEPCYTYEQHEVAIKPSVLMQGKNSLHTPLTPLYKGQIVHGMEVLYPGMMIKVKYDKKPRP